MNLVERAVKGGGTAWLRSRIGHDAALELRVAAASIVPTRALEAVTAAGTGLTAEALAANDIEMGEALAAMAKLQSATIRAVVHHWEDVTTADGEPASFPSDIGNLDEAAFDGLYINCEQALAAGRADPNAGGAR